ncbi:hypothetical protein N9355_03770 [Crocinitomicaceae bacterium]|nr:hypothetical protein [Crocinitomicaceae bacterium]
MKQFVLISILFISSFSFGQVIEEKRGYDPQIGVLVSMLDDLKDRVERSVMNLDQEGTDFLLDSNANRVGALILHLAATEKYYQLYTFEGRGFNKDESMWETALNLGETAQEELVGKPIDYYLDL